MRFPAFIGPSYTLQSVNVDAQACVNLFPEINPLGTGKEREVASLVPTPGLSTLLTLADSPVRGLYTASNGEVYAVGGEKLYSISSAWAATELGTLNTSTGPVSMKDNGTSLVIVDGASGYHWNMSTDTFAEITDSDFYPADQVDFLDGYFIFNRTGTQQFFFSELNSVNLDALDIQSAEGSPDSIVGLKAHNQSAFFFGSNTIEVFYDSGNSDSPFQRIQGAVIDIGCAAAFSIARVADNLFWLGGDENGNGVVYEMRGYQPVRVSTPAIEAQIRQRNQTQIMGARAWSYQQGGHQFYCLNITGFNTTWCYDVSTKMWHERKYLDSWGYERHRADCHTVAFGVNIVGDYETGAIYELDPDTYNDFGNEIVRIRTAPHFSANLKLVSHYSFQLDMEVGVGLTTGQGSDPQAMLDWSDDGGHSWSNERQASIGKKGETKKRVIWRRLGMARDRVYRVKVSDPVKVVLIGAELDVEGGKA